MSIDDLSVIDIIATKPGTDVVQLVVSDHWDRSDVLKHCSQLRAKLTAYLAFIESGELQPRADFQAISSPEICLAVIGLHRPPDTAHTFFTEVEAAICAAGYRFRYEHRLQTLDLSAAALHCDECGNDE